MPIYLTGGGDQENFSNLDNHFKSSLSKNSKLLLLPWAVEEGEQQEALDRVKYYFQHKNIKSIDMAPTPDKLDWDILETYDAILIEGGNTFKLINSVRTTSSFDLIKKFFLLNRPIYADSAGAIMLGDNVQTAFLGDNADEDQHRLQDYRGIGLINAWSVHAHYESTEIDDLNDFLYDKASPIIALSEESGVFIDTHDIHCIGQAPVDLITFEGRITLNEGNSYKLD